MTRTSLAAAPFLAALLSCSMASAAEPAKGSVGRVANAQRDASARFVHRIELKDANGNPIGPKSLVPYSPRQTCTSSRCHDYGTISQGSHTLMFADAEPDPKRPPIPIWTVFDAQTRTQYPLSAGWLPTAKRPFKAKAHKTPFDLARELGAYHPGGGRYELDRERHRYDKTLAANLALRDDATSPDYYASRWDQSGVLELDCLVCHFRGRYDHVERGTQISVLNFQYAPTVGAGFGTVEGKTILLPKSEPGKKPSPGAEPPIKVHYKPGLFDEHGKVLVRVGRPPDRNCLFCHRKPAKEQTPWSDCLDADVHTRSGLACVDCHHATPTHAIFGSRRHAAFLSTLPDFGTLTCRGCHMSGRLGSPVPEHRGLPAFHLEKIACQACHSGPHPRRIPLAIEKPTNFLWGTPGGARTGSGPTVWTPVLVEAHGQLRPVMRMLPRFFARKTPDGFEPLSLSRVKSRIKKIAGHVRKYKALQDELKKATDDAARQKLIAREAKSRKKAGITDIEIQALAADPTPAVINTDAEITALLKLLTRKNSDPEKNYQPLLFGGGTRYALDDADADPLKWTLKKTPDPLADPLDVPLAHSVRPAPQALGAQGCIECHDADSPFWNSVGITRAVGAEGHPEGRPLYARLGKSRTDLALGELREEYLRPYGWIAVFLVTLLIALHYVVFGPHVAPREAPEQYVQRFGLFSRLGHFTLVGSFLVLAATGFSLAAGIEHILGIEIEELHVTLGFALAGAMALVFVLWVRDMVFTRTDLRWLKVMGGYLGYQGHVPADRFNAGQKLLFWKIVVVVAGLFVTGLIMEEKVERLLPLAYTLHELLAYAMVLLILGHVYFGSFALPGTLGAPFTGKVTKAWLKRHHPDYAAKVLGDDEKPA